METNELNTENIVSKEPTSNIRDEDRAPRNFFDQTPEEALNTIANLILVLGIILSIILFIVALSNEGSSRSDREMNPILYSLAIYLFPTSIITWGFFKVLCNISNNLREINKKLK